VGTGVDGAKVGLGFDDASGEKSGAPTFAKKGLMWATRGTESGVVASDEEFAEEIAGDEARIARVERSRKGGEFGEGAGVERRSRHRDLAIRRATATAKSTTPP
jgi:hypothetical protein